MSSGPGDAVSVGDGDGGGEGDGDGEGVGGGTHAWGKICARSPFPSVVWIGPGVGVMVGAGVCAPASGIA